jgi:hypothetical protein
MGAWSDVPPKARVVTYLDSETVATLDEIEEDRSAFIRRAVEQQLAEVGAHVD